MALRREGYQIGNQTIWHENLTWRQVPNKIYDVLRNYQAPLTYTIVRKKTRNPKYLKYEYVMPPVPVEEIHIYLVK